MAHLPRILAGCALAAFIFGVGGSAHAIGSAELRDRLARGDRITLIDIRPRARYLSGHIPGAMNIPASLIATKQLSRIGDVVVYGDGFDMPAVREATAHLDSLPGVNADFLVGGYAAWSGAGRTTSASRGVFSDPTRYFSLHELKQVAGNDGDLILVDMRGASARADLAAEFPQARIVAVPIDGEAAAKTTPLPVASLFGGGRTDASKLIVLVASAKGGAHIVASRLRAAGVRRVAVLAGGDAAIEAGEEPVMKVLK